MYNYSTAARMPLVLSKGDVFARQKLVVEKCTQDVHFSTGLRVLFTRRLVSGTAIFKRRSGTATDGGSSIQKRDLR